MRKNNYKIWIILGALGLGVFLVRHDWGFRHKNSIPNQSDQTANINLAKQPSSVNEPINIGLAVAPLKIKDQTIIFPFTDDNEGETLVIKSDKKVYQSFSGTDIHMSVTNVGKEAEDVIFLMHFAKAEGEVANIQKWDGQKWRDLNVFRRDIKINSTKLGRALGKREAIPNDFEVKAGAQFAVPAGETLYFRSHIKYPPGSMGEFWIEAMGNRGGYGLLDPWYSSNWSYRKRITIDSQRVSGTSNLNNFPVLISRTDNDLKGSASGGFVQRSSGGDILFTKEDGTSKLNHEIEIYTPTTGNLVAWVGATLSATFDTVMYMYYGNSTAADQQNATAVWDVNYKGVWHLPNGTTLTALDSTSNANNGTITGTVAATGQVDGAGSFDGTDDFVSAPVDLSGTSVITISLWLYWNAFANDSDIVFQHNTDGTRGNFQSFPNNSDGAFNFANAESGAAADSVNITRPTAGTWHHYAVVIDRTQPAGETVKPIYVDGVSRTVTIVESGTMTGNFTNSTLYFMSGQGTGSFGAGRVDEFRVSSAIRSADWIKTEYENHYSPSIFASFGAQEIRLRTVASENIKGGVKIKGGVRFR